MFVVLDFMFCVFSFFLMLVVDGIVIVKGINFVHFVVWIEFFVVLISGIY